jgi:hypothetical protein
VGQLQGQNVAVIIVITRFAASIIMNKSLSFSCQMGYVEHWSDIISMDKGSTPGGPCWYVTTTAKAMEGGTRSRFFFTLIEHDG